MNLLPAVFLLGPTAAGKSDLAVTLAQRFNAEIISIDSALVYRHLDIGTAKPEASTRVRVPHHLIDIVEPTQRYSAGQFRSDALAAMAAVTQRGRLPLLVGGTMLYYKALTEGLHELPRADARLRAEIEARAAHEGWPALHAELSRIDPVSAQRVKPSDAQRIQRALEVFQLTGTAWSMLLRRQPAGQLPYRIVACALLPSQRALLHQRIALRFDAMLRAGLIDELAQLRAHYVLDAQLPSMRCVGYRQVWQHLEGEYDRAALREKAIVATRQLAKRQLTWLRSLRDIDTFDCFAPDLAQRIGAHVDAALRTRCVAH